MNQINDNTKTTSIAIRKKRTDKIHKVVIYGFASFTILSLVLIIFFVIFNSFHFFVNWNFWNFLFGKIWNPDNDGSLSSNYGILIISASTFLVLLLSLLFSVPIAIFSSLFICEYTANKTKKWIIGVVRLLAGIPSVIFGLFALTQIGPIFQKMGAPTNQNLLLAAIVLAFMSLPIMISLCINAIDEVPKSYRYASLALGLSKSFTTFRIVKRSARIGIISAIIMGIARIIGETMAIIMIAGNSTNGLVLNNGLASFLFSSIRTLAGTIGLEMLENHGSIHQSALYAIGVILFLCIIIINICVLATQKISHDRQYKPRKVKRHRNDYEKSFNKNYKNLSDKESRDLIWSKAENKKLDQFLTGIRMTFMISSILITILFTSWIVGVVLIQGIMAAVLTSPSDAAAVGIDGLSILGLFLSTIILVLTTMFFAIPLSLIVAIYLSEYSDSKSVFSKILNFSINIMASTPSILFGMFGLAIFISFFNMPLSILSASLTLTFLVLPIMIKSMESSLKNVPQYQKMASLALGASKTESIWKITIPTAVKGLLTAVILSMARVVGESAPVYLTLGTVAKLPVAGFLSPGTTLSVKIYMIFKVGSSAQQLNVAYELALIVLATVLLLNLFASRLSVFFSYNYKWVPFKVKWHERIENIKKLINKNYISKDTEKDE